VVVPSEYCNLTGALQCLTMTRLELTYAVQQVCLHMHDPCDFHLAIIKRLLWYVCGTTFFDLLLLVPPSVDIGTYLDTDWVGCLDTRCSTSCYCVYLGNAHVVLQTAGHSLTLECRGRVLHSFQRHCRLYMARESTAL
jgi:hypothetical protein